MYLKFKKKIFTKKNKEIKASPILDDEFECRFEK